MEEKELMAKKKKRKKSIIFLLSLIIHLSLLLMIISFAFKKFGKKDNKIVLARNKKNELPASLRPRKSNFGTTVFFDDEPKFTPPQATKMAEKERIISETSEIVQEKKEISLKKESQEPLPEKKTLIAKIEKKEPIFKSKEEKTKQTKSIKQTKSDISTEIIRNVGQAKKDQSPEIPKKKSILAMTKGFLQNLKDEGNDWIKRNGDDNKRPDLEDLKHISYIQKIYWKAQQEDKILRNHMTFKEKKELLAGYKIKPIITLVINSDGTLKDLQLVRNSGSINYDSYHIKIFKNAAPYPPVPKHFKENPYIHTFQIIKD